MPHLNWAPKELTIDGPKLERWCLKTLLNFSFNRQLIIGPGTHEPGTIPNELVRIVFGLEEFTHSRGLYTAFRDNETFDLQRGFGYTAKAQGQNLAMGNFRLYGFRFYLNLLPVENRYTAIETSQSSIAKHISRIGSESGSLTDYQSFGLWLRAAPHKRTGRGREAKCGPVS